MPLGGFSYDPELGSRLHELKDGNPGSGERAQALAQEALRRLPQVTAESAVFTPGEAPAVKILISCGTEKTEVEVKL